MFIMKNEMNNHYSVKVLGIDVFGLPIEKKDLKVSGEVIYYPETIKVHIICHNKVTHVGVFPINEICSKKEKSRLIEHPLCDLDFSKKQKDEMMARYGLSENDFRPISRHVPIEPDEKYILRDDESVPIITNENFTYLDDLDDE